jgi:hypothetical protein
LFRNIEQIFLKDKVNEENKNGALLVWEAGIVKSGFRHICT